MIGTGEQSQFGEVFKMMRAEEVRAAGLPGCGASGLWECRGYGAARIRDLRDLRDCGEAEEEGSRAEGGQTQLPTDLF